MDPANLDNIILALLFASDEPLALAKISAVLDDTPVGDIRDAIGRISERFGGEDSVVQLEQVAGGYQLSTNSAYSDYIARLYRGRRKQRLSKAAMETLAIIAYKQPVTRADIENLRGVGCGGVITTLMERSLIRIVGKAKVLGSPFLYGTTQEFLEYLGLNDLKDLPSMEDLEAILAQEAAGDDEFEMMETTGRTFPVLPRDAAADSPVDEPAGEAGDDRMGEGTDTTSRVADGGQDDGDRDGRLEGAVGGGAEDGADEGEGSAFASRHKDTHGEGATDAWPVDELEDK